MKFPFLSFVLIVVDSFMPNVFNDGDAIWGDNICRKKIYEVANVNKQHAAYLQYLPIPMSKDSAKKIPLCKNNPNKAAEKKKRKTRTKIGEW